MYSPYHSYNFSYLMLNNFMGSSFMGDILAKILLRELYMGYIMSVVCVF